jgi:hypothetical protein
MDGLNKLTTHVSRENYIILEELGGSFNDLISEILERISLPQIRSGLATAIESEK